MLVLRRVRRRLLLPPGWVALGFLLLLGCQALLTRGHKLRTQNIVGLLMPPIKADNYLRQILEPVYLSTEKIERYRPWKTILFTGANGSSKLEASESALRALQNDTAHSGGIRIYLEGRVVYNNFIATLDMLNRLNMRYRVCNRKEGFIIYVVTTHYSLKERKEYLAVACKGSGQEPMEAIPLTNAHIIAALWRPEWKHLLRITGAMIILLTTTCLGFVIVILSYHRRSL